MQRGQRALTLTFPARYQLYLNFFSVATCKHEVLVFLTLCNKGLWAKVSFLCAQSHQNTGFIVFQSAKLQDIQKFRKGQFVQMSANTQVPGSPPPSRRRSCRLYLRSSREGGGRLEQRAARRVGPEEAAPQLLAVRVHHHRRQVARRRRRRCSVDVLHCLVPAGRKIPKLSLRLPPHSKGNARDCVTCYITGCARDTDFFSGSKPKTFSYLLVPWMHTPWSATKLTAAIISITCRVKHFQDQPKFTCRQFSELYRKGIHS